MAAVLSNNMSDIKQVSFFWRNVSEWDLIGPDVNESHYKLPLTIIMRCVLGWERLRCREQEQRPLFKIEKTKVQVSFDLTKRIDLRAANKKHWKI
jgi:DNA polymerase-3 subunit alpha